MTFDDPKKLEMALAQRDVARRALRIAKELLDAAPGWGTKYTEEKKDRFRQLYDEVMS